MWWTWLFLCDNYRTGNWDFRFFVFGLFLLILSCTCFNLLYDELFFCLLYWCLDILGWLFNIDFLDDFFGLYPFCQDPFNLSCSFLELRLLLSQGFFCFLQFIKFKEEYLFLLTLFLSYFIFFLLKSRHLLFKKLEFVLIINFRHLRCLCLWLFLSFLCYLRLFGLFGLLELRLIELSSFELSLTHESFCTDPLCIVVRALSCVLKVHKPLDGDDPGPFFIAIAGTEIEHFFKCPYLEASRDHVFFFAKVTLICFDFSKVNELC